MQVTHEEARKLIQFRLDTGLNPHQKIQLSIHLRHCAECRDYAEDMKLVDLALAGASHKQHEVRFLPLSLPMLMEKSSRKIYQGSLLTMRTTMIVLMFAVLAFSTWSFFSGSPPATPGVASVAVPPVPTPSGQSTSTKVSVTDCKMVLYAVREQDTLASLARRFSITEAEIIALNNLKHGLNDSTQVWLPVCHSTPTGTATLTKTRTPILNPITSTPGG